MIYETKGLSLEQIDELYAEVSWAPKSVHWVPTTTFRDIRAASVSHPADLKEKDLDHVDNADLGHADAGAQ